MIGVSSSNKSFRVLARYLAEERNAEEHQRVAWATSRNLPTDDPAIAARIMRASAAQNVRVKDPVYHLALSFDPGDHVDRAAMERVADRVLEGLHLEEHQVLIVAHADREHAHMHLMVNRVHPDTGRVWSRWQDYPTIRRVLRTEEEAMGLRRLSGRSEERGPGTSLADDLRTYEQLVEANRGRYSAQLELSAAQARLAQLDVAAQRARRALERFKESLGAIFRDPSRALSAFLRAGASEPARAVRDMTQNPERLGELLAAKGRDWWGRSPTDDADARAAARAVAGAAREVIDAERAFRAAITRVRTGRGQEAGTPAAEGPGADQEADARAAVRADIEGIQVQLRRVRDEARRAPDLHLFERALARGLWKLSLPEFNRLRLVVTGEQFRLARKLRHVAEDVLLGRDAEM